MDGIIYQAVRNNVQCNYWFRNFIETEGIVSLKKKMFVLTFITLKLSGLNHK